jgi:hypothetical protein
MSNIKYTTKPIHPGSDGFATIPVGISYVFKFGKDSHHDQFMKHEPIINEIETEEKSNKQAENITLTTAAYNAAIMNIKNQLKLSSSLQVHSSDGSLISVFNTEAVPSASSTYTNLEPSFELPVSDISFIEQYLNNNNPSITLPDLDIDDNFFSDLLDESTFDPLLDFDPNMTIQELTPVPMEHEEQYPQQEISSSLPNPSSNDDTTNSSYGSPSEDLERDDMNRRGMKKSGGPVRKLARFGNKQVIKYSDEYHDRRIKNNEAVKKSRSKAKDKQKSCDSQMNQLTDENRALNDRVDLLMKELQVLRSLYKELKQDLPADTAQMIERINTH